MGALPAYISNRGASYWDTTPRPQKIEDPSFISTLFSQLAKPFTTVPQDAARWNAKTHASTIATKIASVGSSIARIGTIVFSAISKGNAASGGYPAKINKVMEIAGVSLSYIKVFYAGVIALSVYDIVIQLRVFKQDPIDALLKIVKDISDIGFAVSISMAGLQEIGRIGLNALKVVPGINIAAGVLSFAEFFYHMKTAFFHKSNVVYLGNRDMKLGEMKTLLRQIRTNKTEGYFEKRYGVDGRVMRRRLREIDRQANKDLKMTNNHATRMKGRLALERILVNLRNRSQKNADTTKMSMIAALVGTVALVIIAFSPLAPLAVLGFGLLALSATLHTVALIHERISYHRFLESMGIQE